MRGRLYALANLGLRFALHLLRLPLRAFARGAGLRRFLRAVEPEGYLPLTVDERARHPASMRCVSCGLCALACGRLAAAPRSAWEEPWTFVVGPSRSIDFAALAAPAAPPCASDAAVNAVCPTAVAIGGTAATLNRLATVTEIA